MIEFEIMVNQTKVNFAPSSEAEEILQNVITICSTPKYSVPLDRAFGIDAELLDSPMTRTGAKYKSEIIQAVRKFEPRARIKRIEFYRDDEAKLFRPKVLIEINSRSL